MLHCKRDYPFFNKKRFNNSLVNKKSRILHRTPILKNCKQLNPAIFWYRFAPPWQMKQSPELF